MFVSAIAAAVTGLLAKILFALSVLFVLLGLSMLAIALSEILGRVQGVHTDSQAWLISLALSLMIVGAALFGCFRFSLRDKRGSVATALLWLVVMATGIYGGKLLFGLLRAII